MKKSISLFAPALTAACVMFTAQATFAQSANGADQLHQAAYIDDVGATERINFSGKLRMLSQRIPSAACNLAAGVDPDGARKLLAGATAEFAAILDALEFGNADMNVNGAEQDRKVIAQLHDLHSKFDPFANVVAQILDGDTSEANIKTVVTDSMAVLGSAKLLVSEISAEYANPAEMTQASAMVIDIAGRQRMLTQKMAKEACAANTGLSATAADDLAGTMQMFDTSLYALTNGMPAAGIKAPPTTAIVSGLATVNQDWNAVKDIVASVAAGGEMSADDATKLFQGLNQTMVNMNKVVGIYTKAEKQET